MPNEEREFIREVQGQRCRQLKVQQCWHEGRVSDPWNVLFLELASDRWVRFFFDAGVFFWKIERPSVPEGQAGMDYRLVTPEIAQAVEGQDIVAADFTELVHGGRTLTLKFEGGTALHLHNGKDRSSVAFVGK